MDACFYFKMAARKNGQFLTKKRPFQYFANGANDQLASRHSALAPKQLKKQSCVKINYRFAVRDTG